MLTKFMVLVAVVVAAGCTTTDPVAVRILSDRLSHIESGNKGSDSDGVNYIILYAKASNGAKIPVKFHQTGSSSFIGPKGEEYDAIPTEAQIQQLYGF